MSIPAQTQILNEIGLRLVNITTGNGYFVDLERLEKASLEPFQNQDMPAINYYATGDILSKKLTNGVRERIVSIVIEAYTSTRDRSFLDVANELGSDVTIALERSPGAPAVSDPVSHSLGDKVVQLEETENTPAIGKGQNPYCGSIIVLNVTYRVSRHDPFTLIT